MEEKLGELIDAVKQNTMPIWLSIILALVPIAISGVVLIVTCVQHKQNKKVQMHNEFLKIYEGFCSAQNPLVKFGNDAVELLANPTEANSMYDHYIDEFNVLIRACNLAILLIPKSDTAFRNMLINIMDEHDKLIDLLEAYMQSSEYEESIKDAWNHTNVDGINKKDYKSLRSNRKAYDNFIKLCRNDTVTKINDQKNRLRELYKYENFDKYFEPYVRIV